VELSNIRLRRSAGKGRFPCSFCPFVCPLETSMYCGKTADSVARRLGFSSWVGPRNDVLDGSPDLPTEKKVNFSGKIMQRTVVPNVYETYVLFEEKILAF